MLSVSARLKGLGLSPLIERWLLFRTWADGFIWSRRPRKRNVTIIFVFAKILINCITRTCLICASRTPPRMASCWPVTPLIIFIFMCSHVITLLPEGKKKHLYPWQYPFSASLPLISTSKHMHRDSLTPRHSLPAKMDFCQCAFVLQLIMCHHVYLSLRVSPRNAISGKWLAFCQHCAHSHPRISVFVGTFVDQLLVRTLTLTSNPLT